MAHQLLVLLLLVAQLGVLAVAYAGDVKSSSSQLGSLSQAKAFSMSKAEFRASGSGKHFSHARELLQALRAKKGEFEAREWLDVHDSQSWKLETFEDTLDKGY